MLFILDSSLIGLDPDSEELNRAITSLLLSYQSGHHLLFMEMTHLRSLRENIEHTLSYSGKKALQTLYNKLPVYKAAIGDLAHFAIVYLPENGELLPTRQGNIWRVPLPYFCPGLLQSTILGENDRDAELYILLANQYRSKKKLYPFAVSGRPRSGGGSGVVRVLDNYLATEIAPCLCVTDSDKVHPGCGKSATVRGCEELARTEAKLVKYLMLEEREIENFLPPDLLERASPEYSAFIENLSNVAGYSDVMWNYLDIKDGIKLEWIERKDEPTKRFWNCFLENFRLKREQCMQCNIADIRSCGCSKINGLGEKVLEKSLDFIKNNPPRLTGGVFDNDSRWVDAGKLAFAFLVCPAGETARQA